MIDRQMDFFGTAYLTESTGGGLAPVCVASDRHRTFTDNTGQCGKRA
jgi:hypothetical protein